MMSLNMLTMAEVKIPNWIKQVNSLFTYDVINRDVHFKNPLVRCFDIIQKLISIKGNDTFSSDDTFPVSFPNIFVDYPSGEMRTGNKSWTKASLRLWHTQLNFAAFCASSACGVSSEHLNYKKHFMVSALYPFNSYYHVRRILKRLRVLLPKEASSNTADNQSLQ